LPQQDITRGRETILLVDDEEMILEVGEKLLNALGYKVILARSGKEAVEIYAQQKDRIDMVVLDMIMSEMGGRETYNRLKELNSKVKVLLSSGYSLDGQAVKILELGCDGFVQKPFNMRVLSQKMREVLART
jgi:CheY-like chemotaxis protein